ncbi:MAG: protein-export chaperone SecB [Pseudomonadota bacterium]
MAENETPEIPVADVLVGDGDAQSGQQQVRVGILAQYVKDLSFENPNAPQSLQQKPDAPKPNMDVNVNVAARKANEEVYEVELKLTVNAKVEDTTSFVVELLYAGLFQLVNLPEQALQPFLLVEAPRLIFPFARRIVSDAVRDGGFPPLMLEPIDFAQLYRRQMESAAAGTNGGVAAN